jgi:branched-chain amino acid transport system permease protein
MTTTNRYEWATYATGGALLLLPLMIALIGGEAAYCAGGMSPVGWVLLAEIAVLGIAALVLQFAPLGDNPLLAHLKQASWGLLAVVVLVALPFLIAAQTETSACERGRAFFWQSILIEMFILGIVAVSYNLLFGFTGIVNFGHAVFYGTGAYLVGILMEKLGTPFGVAILVTLLAGALIALIMGVVGLRIKGLYFALFTLAFAEVFFILSRNRLLVNITGAEDGFTFAVPDMFNTTQNRLFYYYMVLVILVVCYVLVRRLMTSPTGAVLNAIRENEDRAKMLGYNVFHFKLIAFTVSGVMATLAGVLRGVANKGASPNLLGVGVTVDALLQTIIGGAGSFAGPLVGAFSLHLTEHFLRDASITLGATTIEIGRYWALILGVIFVLAVMVFPQGVVGTYKKVVNDLRRAAVPAEPSDAVSDPVQQPPSRG